MVPPSIPADHDRSILHNFTIAITNDGQEDSDNDFSKFPLPLFSNFRWRRRKEKLSERERIVRTNKSWRVRKQRLREIRAMPPTSAR